MPDPGGLVGPREVRATDLGVGTLRAGRLSLAAGVVGSEVTGVTYASRTHGTVQATVTDGHFAFWLPGDELDTEAGAQPRVTARFTDGTSADVVLALR